MFKKYAVVALLLTVLSISTMAIYAQDDSASDTDTDTRTQCEEHNHSYHRDCAPQDPENNPQMNGSRGDHRHYGRGNRHGRGGFRGEGMRGNDGNSFRVILPPASADELPQDMVDLIVEGWEDAQQAHAVYESIITSLGESPEARLFMRIQRAKTRHIAAWEFLFERYSVEVPDVPEFELPSVSNLEEACSVATETEATSVAQYDTILESLQDYPDIYQVTLALRNASEFRHLPAFENCGAAIDTNPDI